MRHEPRPVRASRQRLQRPQHRAFHDRHRTAARHSGLCRQQFRLHPTLGQTGNRRTGHRFNRRSDRLHQIKALRCRILFRVGRIEPIHIRQQDQLIRSHRHRDLRRQTVIVAKADFIGGHGVVFVDDRHHAQPKQGLQRGAAVQIAPAILGILQRHQNLTGGDAVRRQHLFIGPREADLPDRRRRLRLFQRQHAVAQPQHFAPQSNRAR